MMKKSSISDNPHAFHSNKDFSSISSFVLDSAIAEVLIALAYTKRMLGQMRQVRSDEPVYKEKYDATVAAENKVQTASNLRDEQNVNVDKDTAENRSHRGP